MRARSIFVGLTLLTACGDELVDFAVQEAAACRGAFNCHLPNPQSSHRYKNVRSDDGKWPLRAGERLRDGLGGDRGLVIDRAAFVNYGQRKVLFGAPHVYAWNVRLADGSHASGWLREGAFLLSLDGMPTVHGRNPGHGDGDEYVVTGGDPASHPNRELKFDDAYDGPNREPGDYLTRPGGVFNLLYNLPFPGIGGITTDTLPVGVRFVRAASVESIAVPLYRPGGTREVATMRFVYGRVGPRFGWVALDALSPATAASPAPPLVAPGAAVTSGPASASSPRRCCALCRHRAAYHRVDVTQDCTAHARSYCAVGSRGGLIDAAWGVCD